jgi:hypothetical protein
MHHAYKRPKKKIVENVGGVDGPPTCKDVATYLVDIVYLKLFVLERCNLQKKNSNG